MSTTISLMGIEQALLDLMQARVEVQEAIDAGGPEIEERRAELAEIDKTLHEYAAQEARKVDSIVGWLQWAKAEAIVAQEEAKRFAFHVQRIQSNIERLNQFLLDVLRESGQKRLDGSAGRYIRRQANGGVAPLIIDGWDGEKFADTAPLPREYQQVIIRVDASYFDRLVGLDPASIKILDVQPNSARIRSALDVKEEIPGARLGERGEHLRIG